MARYRAFEQNPVTNEWIDRDWVEAGGQDAAIGKLVGKSEGAFFVVPETSFHPVKVARVERSFLTRHSMFEDAETELIAAEDG